MPLPRLTAPLRHAAACVGLLVVTVLGACGGGGGGGNDGVRFSALEASTTRIEVAEGATAPDVVLSAQVSGNVALLDGKTLFVVIDDPIGLFTPTPVIGYDAVSGRASIALAGRPQTVAGSRSGRLGVRVCLDAGCQTALTPAGYGIDLAVTVRAGLRTSPRQVVVREPFGTLPDPSLVRVIVPEGRAASEFDAGMVAGVDNRLVFDLTRQLTPGAEGLRVAPRLLPVGRYERRLEVSALSADLGPGGVHAYLDEVALVLEVEPSTVDFAVLPSSLVFGFDHGTQGIQPFTVGAVAQDGRFELDPVIYDTLGDPPDAATSPLRGNWLSTAGEAWGVEVCRGAACLPPGTYRATLRFVRYSSAGFPTGLTVDVPVALTVR